MFVLADLFALGNGAILPFSWAVNRDIRWRQAAGCSSFLFALWHVSHVDEGERITAFIHHHYSHWRRAAGCSSFLSALWHVSHVLMWGKESLHLYTIMTVTDVVSWNRRTKECIFYPGSYPRRRIVSASQNYPGSD